MNRWFALIPIAALAALGIFLMLQLNTLSGAPGEGREYKPDALVGQPIPETVLPILQGEVETDQRLDLKTVGVGKPMIVNLFASWCAPCRLEHPQLMKLKAQGINAQIRARQLYHDREEVTVHIRRIWGAIPGRRDER